MNAYGTAQYGDAVYGTFVAIVPPRAGMRAIVYSRVGVPERELDAVEYGAIGWGAVDGEASVVVPLRSNDYTRDPAFWHPSRILNRPIVFSFDNGLPPWAGILEPHSFSGNSITLGAAPGVRALTRVAIRSRFSLAGDPLTCLRAAMRRCATDGYPVTVSPKCKLGGPEQRGTQPPTSLYRFLEGLCERTGWNWTVEPQLEDNRLQFAIVLRPELGAWYGRSNALHGGVEVLEDAEQVSRGDRRANEVIALGKADKNNKAPIAIAPTDTDDTSIYSKDQAKNGRISVVVQFPNIGDRGRLQRAARAELARRFYPTQTVQASITDAKRGRAAFELLRLGNVFELDLPHFDSRPARLMGWTYDPNADTASLALRAAMSEPEYAPEEA